MLIARVLKLSNILFCNIFFYLICVTTVIDEAARPVNIHMQFFCEHAHTPLITTLTSVDLMREII